MGHTTRIIPIINNYINDGCDVTIAVNEFQKQILENEIKDVKYIHIEGYNIKFSSSQSQLLSIIKQIPKILKCITFEKQFVEHFVGNNNVDLVISDNKYGFRSEKVKSIFITHQTYIKTPLKVKYFERLLNKINTRIINKFNECWVPDFNEDDNVSGDLSHKNTSIKNIKYIGILSRFEKVDKIEKTNNILAILSGPEPQRTIFEDILIEKLEKLDSNSIIIRGTNINKKQNTDRITFINIANTNKLQELINISEKIISRSGYSSIMDYIKLNRKAILVPTPGQTEQEYLAKYLSNKRGFNTVSQNEINDFIF